MTPLKWFSSRCYHLKVCLFTIKPYACILGKEALYDHVIWKSLFGKQESERNRWYEAKIPAWFRITSTRIDIDGPLARPDRYYFRILGREGTPKKQRSGHARLRKSASQSYHNKYTKKTCINMALYSRVVSHYLAQRRHDVGLRGAQGTWLYHTWSLHDNVHAYIQSKYISQVVTRHGVPLAKWSGNYSRIRNWKC